MRHNSRVVVIIAILLCSSFVLKVSDRNQQRSLKWAASFHY